MPSDRQPWHVCAGWCRTVEPCLASLMEGTGLSTCAHALSDPANRFPPTAIPPAVNELSLPVPRANKKKRYARQSSEQQGAEQQGVLVQPLGVGSTAGAAGTSGASSESGGVQLRRVSGTAVREDSATQLPVRGAGSSGSRLSMASGRLGERPRTPSPPLTPAAAGGRQAPRTPEQGSSAAAEGTEAGGGAAAAVEPVGAAAVLDSRAGAGRRVSPAGLARVSGHIDQLRQLASNPWDALRRKECQLHITATYLPLTEQELAAMEREAGRQQGGGGPTAMQRVSTLAATSPRIANLLHRWAPACSHAQCALARGPAAVLVHARTRRLICGGHGACGLRCSSVCPGLHSVSPLAAACSTSTWIEHRTWPAARRRVSRATCEAE